MVISSSACPIIFVFVANYLIPIMIGARDMSVSAPERVSGFWMFLL